MLAECYIAAHKPDLSAFHLMEAVRCAKYSDSHAPIAISFRLASQLNSMERYADAEAVIDAMRDHHQQIVPGQLSSDELNATDIFHSVIYTRRMHYAESVQTGKRVAHRFHFPNLSKLVFAPSAFANAHKQAVKNIHNLIYALNPSAQPGAQIPATLDQPRLQEEVSRIAAVLNFAHDYAGGAACTTPLTSFSELVSLAVTKYVTNSIDDTNGNSGNSQAKPFPGVFVDIVKHWSEERFTLETVSTLVYCWGSQHGLKFLVDQFVPATGDTVEAAFDTIFYSHVVAHYARQAWNSLTQFAELCNSLAYNRAETGIGLHYGTYALIDAHCAAVVMAFLLESTSSDTPQRHEATDMLAQICDTYGWVNYRRTFPATRDTLNPLQRGGNAWLLAIHGSFATTENYLLKGIRLDPKRAIIHYHLAPGAHLFELCRNTLAK